MARKANGQKILNVNVLKGILCDQILNIKNGVAKIEDAKVLNNSIKELCRLNKEQRESYVFLNENPGLKKDNRFIEQ